MPLHSTAWFPISLREPSHASVTFWRRPPQSNCPPGSVPDPAHGSQVRLPDFSGWYFNGWLRGTWTPGFKASHLSYAEQARKPLPSCSKGSRGLSVLPRVEGIFTPIAISLSPGSRQWGSRYAIRAGRNLPDKEFRYLRTVIVTAAVYRGFGSMLRLRLTSPLNLPAPGRRQTLYVLLRVRRVLCF